MTCRSDSEKGDVKEGGDHNVNENGEIWTDPATGLTWQRRQADKFIKWSDAIYYCMNLRLGGLTDWRLPSISKLRTLIRGCAENEIDGSCSVTDSCSEWDCFDDCPLCDYGNGPNQGCYCTGEVEIHCDFFDDSVPDLFWSSTPGPDINSYWGIDFFYGTIWNDDDNFKNNVRCVHD